jgi:hypothetical protein
VVVNGLPLPRHLVTLIEAGRWKAPADRGAVDRLFPENGGLCPYSVAQMAVETQGLFNPRLFGGALLGVSDPDRRPGDIDPRLAVIVADLGHGFDQPIAIDYRTSRDRPQVVTIQWPGQAGPPRWVIVAPDILTFAELVGL